VSARIDLTGYRFGRMVAISYSVHKGRPAWICSCDCGTETILETGNLRSGREKSCGCYTKEYQKKAASDRYKEFQSVLNIAKYSANKRGLEFSISLDFYKSLAGMDCHYCHCQLRWNNRTNSGRLGGSNTGHNLDRKDNSLGYTEDNVVPCCAICNRVKMDDIGYDDMILIGRARKAYREQLR
jgi:hypothetical protein